MSLAAPVDSKEGIEYLLRWAKAHNIVLDERHERIALKYGVPTAGAIFARPIPLTNKPAA